MKSTYHCQNSHTWLYLLPVPAGYGFVDFDSPASAQKAVTALKAGGVQAQMAKVRTACVTFSMSVGFDSRRHGQVRSHRWMECFEEELGRGSVQLDDGTAAAQLVEWPMTEGLEV